MQYRYPLTNFMFRDVSRALERAGFLAQALVSAPARVGRVRSHCEYTISV